LQLWCFEESHWKYNVILDTGCWMFLDFTTEAFLDIQYPVSSIKHQASSRHPEALIFTLNE